MVVGFTKTSDSDQLNLFNLDTLELTDSLRVNDVLTGEDEQGRFNGGYMTPDGSVTYLGSRGRPYVAAFDTATMSTSKYVALFGETESDSYVGDLRPDPSGRTLYAAVAVNNSSVIPCEFFLSRVDAATMVETGRVTLASSILFGPRGPWMAINADGTMAAVSVGRYSTYTESSVHFIDLATMTEIDTDSGTEGIQSLDVTGTVQARHLIFSADGSTLYVGGNRASGTEALVAIDTSSYQVTPIDLGIVDATYATKGLDLVGTTLYIAMYGDSGGSGIYTYDGSSVDKISGNEGHKARQVKVMVDGQLMVTAEDQIRFINPSTGDVDARLTGSQSLYNHYTPVTPF
jgi:hypothetical protein